MSLLLRELEDFVQEHERCGELDGGVEGERQQPPAGPGARLPRMALRSGLYCLARHEMPKRHNIFQDLMAAIHQQLVSPCVVVESEMLRDPTSGQDREVDLVIRSNIGGCEVVISVECTDRKRPVPVEWVEQMCCKHRDLPTNKLVLVSKSGYTATAHAKALASGVEPLSLDTARQVIWAKYVDRCSKLLFVAIHTVPIMQVVSPTYAPDHPYQGIPAQTKFLDPEGTVRASAVEIANALLAKEQVLSATVGQMDEGHSGGWTLGVSLRPGVRIRFPNGLEHDVEELKVVFIAKPVLAHFDLQRASFRGTQVAFGVSRTEHGDLLLTIVEAEGSSPSAQVRLRGHAGEVQAYDLAGGRTPGPPAASDEAMRAIVGPWRQPSPGWSGVLRDADV